MVDPNSGHNFGRDVPRRIITYIYENLPNSGIKPGDLSKGKNDKWTDPSVGIFEQFDQNPFIKSAIKEFASVEGGKADVDPRLGDTGYVYYPNQCVDKVKKVSCKLMIVFHGANGKARGMAA